MKTYARLRRRYDYTDYEQAKREWQARHPDATPEQYQVAMMRIAARMGL
jgi:hypothetical protein